MEMSCKCRANRCKEKSQEPNFQALDFQSCRGDRIRTCDRLVPNQKRYRAALHPENPPCRKATAKVGILLLTCKFLRIFI